MRLHNEQTLVAEKDGHSLYELWLSVNGSKVKFPRQDGVRYAYHRPDSEGFPYKYFTNRKDAEAYWEDL